jgi:hypothetical protein
MKKILFLVIQIIVGLFVFGTVFSSLSYMIERFVTRPKGLVYVDKWGREW